MAKFSSLSKEEQRLAELNGLKSYSEYERFFGPEYPEMGADVAKFRRAAAKAGSIGAMAESKAYGEAVLKVIAAKQRSALVGAAVAVEGPCREILSKIRAEQKAALSRCPSEERKARSPAAWKSAYEAAMMMKWKAAGAAEMKMAA